MNRKQMMQECPEDFEDKLKEILDHIEDRVNEAKLYLDNVDGIYNLKFIEDSQTKLEQLSNDLY